MNENKTLNAMLGKDKDYIINYISIFSALSVASISLFLILSFFVHNIYIFRTSEVLFFFCLHKATKRLLKN